jgi:hypothetical protein
MNRLFVVSVLGVALLLASFVAVLYRSGDGDRSGSAHSTVPAAAVPAPAAVKPLPAPTGERVLRIAGVKTGNVSATVTELDFKTLDRAATDEITIVEPFVKRKMTFTGIRMAELLQRAGVDPSARNLYMHALDDYHVDLPIAGLKDAGFVATRVDGKKLPIAKGGPIRLLFTGKGKLARDTDNWIWSFDSARVER